MVKYSSNPSSEELEVPRNNLKALESLSIAAIVAISSRPGSDLLHSLFDSHPEVLTFNGYLRFDDFYDKAITIWGTKVNMRLREKIKPFSASDFFYEFAWAHIHNFKSKYDTYEKKDKLGKAGKDCNSVDIDTFVKNAVFLLGDNSLSRKSALLVIYGAYALTRGENLSTKKLLLHNVHYANGLRGLSKDFRSIKVLGSVRDPRSYFSNLDSLWEYSPKIVTSSSNYYLLKRVLVEGDAVIAYKNVDLGIVLLEKLHEKPEAVLSNISKWLGIEFDQSLMHSTWGGKAWLGDDMSIEHRETFNPNSYSKSIARWEKSVNCIDEIIIEFLKRPKMKQYGYRQQYSHKAYILLIPLLILLPNKNELKILWYDIKNHQLYNIAKWPAFLFLRIFTMYGKFIKVILNMEKEYQVLSKPGRKESQG